MDGERAITDSTGNAALAFQVAPYASEIFQFIAEHARHWFDNFERSPIEPNGRRTAFALVNRAAVLILERCFLTKRPRPCLARGIRRLSDLGHGDRSYAPLQTTPYLPRSFDVLDVVYCTRIKWPRGSFGENTTFGPCTQQLIVRKHRTDCMYATFHNAATRIFSIPIHMRIGCILQLQRISSSKSLVSKQKRDIRVADAQRFPGSVLLIALRRTKISPRVGFLVVVCRSHLSRRRSLACAACTQFDCTTAVKCVVRCRKSELCSRSAPYRATIII